MLGIFLYLLLSFPSVGRSVAKWLRPILKGLPLATCQQLAHKLQLESQPAAPSMGGKGKAFATAKVENHELQALVTELRSKTMELKQLWPAARPMPRASLHTS